MTDENALPCCSACKWAKPTLGIQTPSWLNNEPRMDCGFHSFVVWEPRLHFCSHLTTAAGERHPVVEREQIADGQMYVWVEIAFRILAAPDVKHVHHELAAVAPLSEYARMTTIEKSHIYYGLHHTKWKAFEQGHSEEIKEEHMYRKTRRLGKRLNPKGES